MAPLASFVAALAAASTLVAPALAAPAPFWFPKGIMVPTSLSTKNVLSSVSLTLTNGSTTLPAPASGLSLQAFALGVGFQNYTCNTTSNSYAAVGAVATLLNAADLMPYFPSGHGQDIMNLLPSFLYQVGRATIDASVLPKAGLHYFSAPKTPTFDLTPAGLGLFYGASTGDITAPTSATSGPNGAVDWLALSQKAGLPTNNKIKMVYRIFTASGKPPTTCSQAGELQMPYSAQYFFFG